MKIGDLLCALANPPPGENTNDRGEQERPGQALFSFELGNHATPLREMSPLAWAQSDQGSARGIKIVKVPRFMDRMPTHAAAKCEKRTEFVDPRTFKVVLSDKKKKNKKRSKRQKKK